ncbi:dentin sialophosphoprotein-like isoform X3 [Pecten maximus]|uniref:dentin sialophosphoprotein-like isoform X3 n=1 Tax=Pecten maximus TaxID=6579 RepID=UPI0014586BC0|nr:dentin sialophosphoprotein-like isoform X3 [Pecten maximus]
MSSRSGSSDDLDTWEVVSRASSNEPDLEDSDSDSSIEVVSVDTDTECELAMSSSPSLGAGSVNPVFVLRVPSTEADGLSGESSESADEGDVTITKALQAVCHRQDVDFSSGEKTAQGHGETPQGHGEIPTTHGREETDIEPGSSVDLSSSNISMTSMSSDTDRTVDTSVSESVDGADSTDLVRSARSIKSCSSKKSLNDEHTLVDTTLTDEGSFSQTDEGRSVMVDGGSTSGVDEGSLSKSEEESSSGTESTTAAEPFPSLPPLPSLPVDPDIVAKVTDLVELRKPLNVAEQDMGDGGHVPDKAEINRGYIVEDKDDDEKNPNKAVSEADDEEIHEAVPDSGDSMEEPQEGFDIEAVHPKIENSVPPSKDGDDLAENSTKSTSIIQETRKFPGNIGTTPIIVICITVLVVISFLNGYMVGKTIKSTVAKEMADFKYEIARIHQRDLEARDTEIDFLQQSIDWMTDYASYDLDKLQSSNTELVLDPKFTAAGYEHVYFLFTFGKYADNNGRELVRRDKLTTEEVQCKNSIELMNKVNHLEQERADLIQLVEGDEIWVPSQCQ